MRGYTIKIHAEIVAGESGWWYSVLADGREVFGGWERGKKANALDAIRSGIRARDALRAAAGLEVAS